MISEKETKRISKYLSFVLRHQPETLGITLDTQGWTSVPVLLQKMQEQGFNVSHELLAHVVDTNSKKRFAFNDDQSLIRASQGHSVDIDTGYQPQEPPAVLYHGTAQAFLPSIFSTGLEKRGRQHVHLSSDRTTAVQVGGRHGKPFVLLVDAAGMYRDGHHFYCSDNGVWLTDHVPVAYLREEGL